MYVERPKLYLKNKMTISDKTRLTINSKTKKEKKYNFLPKLRLNLITFFFLSIKTPFRIVQASSKAYVILN